MTNSILEGQFVSVSVDIRGGFFDDHFQQAILFVLWWAPQTSVSPTSIARDPELRLLLFFVSYDGVRTYASFL